MARKCERWEREDDGKTKEKEDLEEWASDKENIHVKKEEEKDRGEGVRRPKKEEQKKEGQKKRQVDSRYIGRRLHIHRYTDRTLQEK